MKGRSNGWPGERWLDIRRLDVLGPDHAGARSTLRPKGFDGVEFDNVDGYTNHTGFPLTPPTSSRYNVWLANLAHRHGLAVALKNDIDQVARSRRYFDFALDEQCFQYDECAPGLRGWAASGKAVFCVEYRQTTFRAASPTAGT